MPLHVLTVEPVRTLTVDPLGPSMGASMLILTSALTRRLDRHAATAGLMPLTGTAGIRLPKVHPTRCAARSCPPCPAPYVQARHDSSPSHEEPRLTNSPIQEDCPLPPFC